MVASVNVVSKNADHFITLLGDSKYYKLNNNLDTSRLWS